MARVRLHVDGLKEAERALRDLGPKVARRVLRKAVQAGANRWLYSAQLKVPVDSGLLLSTLVAKTGTSKKKGRVSARVGMKAGDFKGESFYGSFLEYGTHKMEARPYLRPAFDEQRENATNIVRAKLREGIEAEARRIARQQERAAKRKAAARMGR